MGNVFRRRHELQSSEQDPLFGRLWRLLANALKPAQTDLACYWQWKSDDAPEHAFREQGECSEPEMR
jgi:hypothetical protein